MDRTRFMAEVERQLKQHFRSSKEGFKTPQIDRHRLEGFMFAGVFLGLTTNSELNSIMNDLHMHVFGKSIEQRKSEMPNLWKGDEVNYGTYDSPSYQRVFDE